MTFPKCYEVQGDTITVDEADHRALNILAGRFYALHGNRHIEDFDYAASTHPMEKMMYQLALEAMFYQQETGALDG
ncbi:hypothetical protein J4N45_10890 [Vibrio sp. SCSIO 43140]|uniref:hypothetical protein n=1 Tax=Vibrio sp. SCSIO 43140 TaxID=2819100 RepID=UPI002075C301|nr:hypothetical protein [Vibrio sp. SCSIO 43140]USD59036.1 hypothetical protein J4N45_10890 [Vibrio sp. SCSIO 43140]